MAYLLFDIATIAVLFWLGTWVIATETWYLLPPYALAQGSMFWALFLIGHDAGHGSFARQRRLSSIVGYLTNTPVLVPYHAWRISHRIHHSNTGNVKHDESHTPMTERQFRRLPKALRAYRKLLMYTASSFPLYLLMNNFGRRRQSHFNPWAPMFRADERRRVLASVVAVMAAVGLLAALSFAVGLLPVLLLYGGPYLVFSQWFIIVTFLHHTAPDVPWYYDDDWDRFTGNLSTVDRSYGRVINFLHHNIGFHVAHHIMTTVPHYRLRIATKAIQPLLGDRYRSNDEFFLRSYLRTIRQVDFVPDGPGPVYFTAAAKEAGSRAGRPG